MTTEATSRAAHPTEDASARSEAEQWLSVSYKNKSAKEKQQQEVDMKIKTSRKVIAPPKKYATKPHGFGKQASSASDNSTYPTAHRDDTVVDHYHGWKVRDPYRHLANPEANKTKKFIEQLNAISEPFLEKLEHREDIRQKLSQFLNYNESPLAIKKGAYYYYEKHDGQQLSYEFTNDGVICAYGLSKNGSDWTTIKFKTTSGENLEDVITSATYGNIAWTGDNTGIFYNRYHKHKGAFKGTSTKRREGRSLYYHNIGTEAAKDVLVYQSKHNSDHVRGFKTSDGRFLIIVSQYYDLRAVGNKINGTIEPIPFVDKQNISYMYIDHDEEKMILITNKDAPMNILVTRCLEGGTSSVISEFIPENPKAMLESAWPLIGIRVLLRYIEDVKHTLYMHERSTGRRLYQIPLEIGTVSIKNATKEDNELVFTFESFLVRMVEYRMDFSDVPIEKMPEMKEILGVSTPGLDMKSFKVEQVYWLWCLTEARYIANSMGTVAAMKNKYAQIPMFVISNKSMRKNGANPVLLNAYGGFRISKMPSFCATKLMFVRHFGGVYDEANIWGGGTERYGIGKMKVGMKENKQNSFDDFIAAAEYLVKQKYTKPSKLLDMLRFHKHTGRASWISEYSPLHNIRIPEAGQWPATLLMTADHDDRVVPSHTLKYVARLYEKANAHGKQRNPIVARIEKNAGHGLGNDNSKIHAKTVDILAFILHVLGIKWIP